MAGSRMASPPLVKCSARLCSTCSGTVAVEEATPCPACPPDRRPARCATGPDGAPTPTRPPPNRSLKRVSSLRMYIEESDVEPHLVFDRNCEGGVLRRHRFHLQDWDVVHAVYDKEGGWMDQ
jgi:hypothetical protein